MSNSEIELQEAIVRQQDEAQYFEEMDQKEVDQVKQAVDNAMLLEEVKRLAAEVEKLRTQPKNQRVGKANDKNHYKLLSKEMQLWGNVPNQQRDIALILAERMELGKEYTETEVFSFLVDGAGEYPSITRSVQDVTYLFRYYRGIKTDAKYGSFVGRKFLQTV